MPPGYGQDNLTLGPPKVFQAKTDPPCTIRPTVTHYEELEPMADNFLAAGSPPRERERAPWITRSVANPVDMPSELARVEAMGYQVFQILQGGTYSSALGSSYSPHVFTIVGRLLQEPKTITLKEWKQFLQEQDPTEFRKQLMGEFPTKEPEPLCTMPANVTASAIEEAPEFQPPPYHRIKEEAAPPSLPVDEPVTGKPKGKKRS